MKKLKKHNELEVGKYYQLADQDTGEGYKIVTNLICEIAFWKNHVVLKTDLEYYRDEYYYSEISEFSYNRIKRNVMRRLGLVENL